jgi:protein gp37
MGLETKIEWCDSTLNLMMGCDGCELWNPDKGIKHCYAGILTERYGGGKGWPVTFGQPATFPERLAPALRWPDLTGKARPGKPWLDGYPRTIFLDDLGDTFTPSLPLDWLTPHISPMAFSPHIYIFLTKRASRMRRFFAALPELPQNFWLGTTVTTQSTLARVRELCGIQGAAVRWLSIEPLLGPVEIPAELLSGIQGVVIGGESGAGAREFCLEWAERLVEQCQAQGVAVFVKQLGSNAMWGGRRLKLKDKKGGDMTEWPEGLRIRQMPAWQRQAAP